MNQINTMDTYSMLASLKELEGKLAEHHRQDVLMGSILPRLEILEKEKALAASQHTYQVPVGTSAFPVDMTNDERLLRKLQASIDLVSEKYNLTLESKLSSVSLELDRVHKLLSIRPTTSEVSKIMLTVQEMKGSLMKTILENATFMQDIIKDKVAEEMSSLIDNIRSSGDIGLKGLDGIVKQIENISVEVNSIRTAANNETKLLADSLTEQQKTIRGLRAQLMDVHKELVAKNEVPAPVIVAPIEKEESEEEARTVKLSIELEALKDSVEKFQKESKDNFLFSDTSLQGLNEMVSDLNREVKVGQEEAKATNISLEGRVKLIDDAVRSQFDSVKEQLKDVVDKFDRNDSFISYMKSAEVVKYINQHTAQLASVDAQFNTAAEHDAIIQERFELLEANLLRAEKENMDLKERLVLLTGSMNKSIEQAVKAVELKLEQKYETLQLLNQRHTTELAELKEAAAVQTDIVTSIDMKGKILKKELVSATQKLEEFQATTAVALRKFEDGNQRRADEINALTPQIDQLANRMKSAVAAVDKNEDQIGRIILRLEEKEKAGVLKPRPAGMRVLASLVSQTAARKAPTDTNVSQTAMQSPVIASPSGRQLPVRISSPEARKPPMSPSAATVSFAENRPLTADRNSKPPPSPMTSLVTAPETPADDDDFFAFSPDFESNLNEIKEEIQSHAECVAELGRDYEECSIKASRALEIPRALCEFMTQTAQTITAFISNEADTETVIRVLRGDPKDVSYDQSSVSQLRQQKLDRFMNDVIKCLGKGGKNSDPGLVRIEARESFMKKLHTALVLCMSKHDQVELAVCLRFSFMTYHVFIRYW